MTLYRLHFYIERLDELYFERLHEKVENGVQLFCECEYLDQMTLSPGDPLFAFITFAHRILIA